MLPLQRFEVLLAVVLICFELNYGQGFYVIPQGFDNPYQPYNETVPSTNTAPTPTIMNTPAPATMPITETPPSSATDATPTDTMTMLPVATTTTTPLSMTTMAPPTSTTPMMAPLVQGDDVSIKYYRQYNYYYPNGGMFSPMPTEPEGTPSEGLRLRQSAPLRNPNPMPVTYETTYMTGPNMQGTMVRLVSNDSSGQSSSTIVQSQSSTTTAGGIPMTMGGQGVGAPTLMGYYPYNELLSRPRNNYPPPMFPFAMYDRGIQT